MPSMYPQMTSHLFYLLIITNETLSPKYIQCLNVYTPILLVKSILLCLVSSPTLPCFQIAHIAELNHFLVCPSHRLEPCLYLIVVLFLKRPTSLSSICCRSVSKWNKTACRWTWTGWCPDDFTMLKMNWNVEWAHRCGFITQLWFSMSEWEHDVLWNDPNS